MTWVRHAFSTAKRVAYNHGCGCTAAQMQTLNLDPKLFNVPIKRPASEFPDHPADVYICDKCGMNITAHLHLRRAHVRQPIGPVRYVCRCGQSYVSGAIEWDYMSDWAKEKWLKDVLLIFILLTIVAGWNVCLFCPGAFQSLNDSAVCFSDSVCACMPVVFRFDVSHSFPNRSLDPSNTFVLQMIIVGNKTSV